ncbi:hypothetical protein PR048_027020 [Dryococelus australis]|uniref:Uncharacterized protein n=1 Tax=Dryococelus australis TaxID=614101 RepID=A0ABQ9GMY6_9NEOP|nr:hypothetical protein PR048_027020 [Dryococelus australis]
MGSQDLGVKSRTNLFTRSLRIAPTTRYFVQKGETLRSHITCVIVSMCKVLNKCAVFPSKRDLDLAWSGLAQKSEVWVSLGLGNTLKNGVFLPRLCSNSPQVHTFGYLSPEVASQVLSELQVKYVSTQVYEEVVPVYEYADVPPFREVLQLSIVNCVNADVIERAVRSSAAEIFTLHPGTVLTKNPNDCNTCALAWTTCMTGDVLSPGSTELEVLNGRRDCRTVPHVRLYGQQASHCLQLAVDAARGIRERLAHRRIRSRLSTMKTVVSSRELKRLSFSQLIFRLRLTYGLKANTENTGGAAVMQWLDSSPPTKANRVRFQGRGRPRIFRCCNRAGRCRWSTGFSRRSPVSTRHGVPAQLDTRLASPSSVLHTSILSITPFTAPMIAVADSPPTGHFSRHSFRSSIAKLQPHVHSSTPDLEACYNFILVAFDVDNIYAPQVTPKETKAANHEKKKNSDQHGNSISLMSEVQAYIYRVATKNIWLAALAFLSSTVIQFCCDIKTRSVIFCACALADTFRVPAFCPAATPYCSVFVSLHQTRKMSEINGLQTRLYSLTYKYGNINFTLVVCCHTGRRQLDTVLQEIAGMKVREKREISEKTRRPAALYGTIPTNAEKSGSNPAGYRTRFVTLALLCSHLLGTARKGTRSRRQQELGHGTTSANCKGSGTLNKYKWSEFWWLAAILFLSSPKATCEDRQSSGPGSTSSSNSRDEPTS